MPAEIMVDFFLRPLLELIIQLAGYFTARILFPIFSFGYITIAPSAKDVKAYPKWHGFNRISNGKTVIHEEMGALLGIIFWIIFIGISVYVYSKLTY